MERLANAMETRGFLVSPTTDSVYFSQGNAREELYLLERMFQEIGCDATIEDRQIYIHSPLTDEQLERIIWYPARNHEAGGGSGWRSWKYFSRRNHGAKVNTFVLETGVALMVKALSAAGFSTNCSCDGHGRRTPSITFSGRVQAIWFNLLFQEVKEGLGLIYDWKFKEKSVLDPEFVAYSRSGRFELHNVLEDTSKIAHFFLEHAEEISNNRKAIFGKHYKSRRKLVRSMTDEELYNWMSENYCQHKNRRMFTNP